MLARTMACALLAGTALAGAARATEVQSVSRIAFGPANTLFLADWRGGEIDAITLPPAEGGPDAPFNMLDLEKPIRDAMGTADVKVRGLAKRRCW